MPQDALRVLGCKSGPYSCATDALWFQGITERPEVGSIAPPRRVTKPNLVSVRFMPK